MLSLLLKRKRNLTARTFRFHHKGKISQQIPPPPPTHRSCQIDILYYISEMRDVTKSGSRRMLTWFAAIVSAYF